MTTFEEIALQFAKEGFEIWQTMENGKSSFFVAHEFQINQIGKGNSPKEALEDLLEKLEKQND